MWLTAHGTLRPALALIKASLVIRNVAKCSCPFTDIKRHRCRVRSTTTAPLANQYVLGVGIDIDRSIPRRIVWSGHSSTAGGSVEPDPDQPYDHMPCAVLDAVNLELNVIFYLVKMKALPGT